MNRRDLLKYLLSTPLATFVDYEKLLWVPNKTIVVINRKDIILRIKIMIDYDMENMRQELTRLYLAI